MSKIGRKALLVPEGVTVKSEGGKVIVNGPLGTLTLILPASFTVKVDGDKVWLKPAASEGAAAGSLWGFYHRSLGNALVGTSQGFAKVLELAGVGYRAKKEGEAVVLSVGFSHPLKVTPPAGVTLSVEADTKIKVSGLDKQKVGEVAAKIRALKPAEPYKGKGIKYAGEVLRKKVGKAGKVGVAFGTK